MATKTVNLVIKLKDNVSSKLSKIRGGLGKMGAAFKKAALATVAMAAAVGVAMVKMVKVFAAQQDAEIALASALDNVGLSGQKLLPIFQEYATSIQRVTKYGDEGILAAMAYGKNLGINTGQLKEATTAAIGLAAKYKIDLQTAMMLVGRASQGQTQMLTRYGIVMDETLSPQEKFNDLLVIGAEAFKLAEAETQSASGAWTQFKNAVGDAQETIIAAITDGDDMIGMINGMTEAVARLIDDGDLSAWANDVKIGFDAITPAIEKVWFLIQAVAAGARTIGGFIGGSLGEMQNQGTERATFGGMKKQFAAGLEAGKTAQQDYLDRKEAFKKAFVEERAAKLKLAEEVAEKELGAQDEINTQKQASAQTVIDAERIAAAKIRLWNAEGNAAALALVEKRVRAAKLAKDLAAATTDKEKKLIRDAYKLEEDKLVNAATAATMAEKSARVIAEKSARVIAETAPEIAAEIPSALTPDSLAQGLGAPTAPTQYGGGITDLAGVNEIFGSLTTRKLEGGGGLTTNKALEQIKELLGTNPEDMAEALKTALVDVYQEAWQVNSESLSEQLEITNDTLAEMYKLQQDRLGGVLN